MKILFYGINFAPELIGVGKYSSETVEYLVSQGHDVRVVAAPPYYPQWRVDPAYRAARYRRETIHGAQVWRVPLWVPRRPTGLMRLIHLMSFAASSIPVLLMQWRWKPDLVFQVAPTLFCSFGALALGHVTGARTWLHIQDFEVDAAFGLNVLKNGPLRKFVSAVETFLLRRFDRVSTISCRMLEKAAGKGVNAARLVYFPNWVDTSTIGPGSCADLAKRPAAYRRELNIDADALVALYSGNMGDKQGLEVIADAARVLAQTPQLVFVLCGDGAAKAALVTACAGLDNVRFVGMQPAERLGALLDMADIHLLPQRAGAADLVMPSKLGAMFASGKPVVAIADAGTELANVVGSRGCVVPTGDLNAFAAAIVALAYDPARRAALGGLGRQYALDQLDKARILSAIAHSLCVFAGTMEPAEQSAATPATTAAPPTDAPGAQVDLRRIPGK